MITVTRTGEISDDLPRAIAFAKELGSYMRHKHSQPVSLAMPHGGNPFTICWITQFGDLAALETFRKTTMQDPDYVALIQSGVKFFIPGSIHEEIWSIFASYL